MQKQDISWTILILCCSTAIEEERRVTTDLLLLTSTAEQQDQTIIISSAESTPFINHNPSLLLSFILIICLSFLLSFMSIISHHNSLPTPIPSPPRAKSPTGTTTTTTTTEQKELESNEKKKFTIVSPPLSNTQQVNRLIRIFQKFLKELDGRDKTIKFFQYLFKILLHYKLVHSKTWSPMVSNFSMTRKILRVGLFMGPVRELAFSNPDLMKSCFLLNEVGNTLADDIFCFYKMGLVGHSLGKKAELIAIYCWFAGILHDLHENVQSLKELRRQQSKCIAVDNNNNNNNSLDEKVFTTQISIVKLIMDGVFCGTYIKLLK